jgi:SAM-dependent methyltransferase
LETPYNKAFYDNQSDGSQRSAAVVVPLMLELFKVESVIDVGCGVGTWLQVFAENGVPDYLGVDGNYVDRAALRIPESRFRAADLRQGIDFGRRFDLACSLEVAEHLPPSAADSFVATLVRAAPLVLFSAAIPAQGGTAHINEQWQSYWVQRFAQHSYEAIDCVRPRIYGNSHVEWWYQQNILLFCAPGARPSQLEATSSAYALDRVHPQLLKSMQDRPHSARQAVTAITRSAKVLARLTIERLVQSVT